MNKKDAVKIVEILKQTYPDATCSLDFETPFQAVVAVILSAQCTDERVNKTTPALFERCKTVEDFANIDIKELEDFIHPCGFCRCAYSVLWRRRLYLCVCDFVQHDDCNNLLF